MEAQMPNRQLQAVNSISRELRTLFVQNKPLVRKLVHPTLTDRDLASAVVSALAHAAACFRVEMLVAEGSVALQDCPDLVDAIYGDMLIVLRDEENET